LADQPRNITHGRLPHVTYFSELRIPIKVGNEVIGAVGVSGSPGKDDDCSQARIDKVADQLK
jgi:uncharacterized protein GlcG (DUF336 family)